MLRIGLCVLAVDEETRGDAVAANNRSAQRMVCYVDALFAANRVLDPGEKRLVTQSARFHTRRIFMMMSLR